MLTLSQQIEELVGEIRQIEILDDDVEKWKKNKVTRRFLLEVQYAMMLVLEMSDDDDYAESVDRTALIANRRRAMKDSYEEVLGWNANFLED